MSIRAVILDGSDDICHPAKALVNISESQTNLCHKTLLTTTIELESIIYIETGYKTVCEIEELKPGDAKKLMLIFCEGDEGKIEKNIKFQS